ncbi:MAG: response regulator [Desulfovibrionaceae bacterium]|jgi:DNA-binding NtrC family response regulator|nr:response regulator [Desulfovibrionaceae bacterium]
MPTIVLVEDDDQIRTMLQETLALEGYRVLAAENGIKALEVLKEHEADLLITDILMPEKEGLGLITEVRRQAPHLPIIAVSGGAPNIQAGCNLELAGLFGANHVFQKPLDIDDLLRTVRDCLD